jgi:hypothetical protein
MNNRLNQLKEIVEIQSMDGNWNYSPHMYAVYVGLRLALSIMEDKELDFKEPPEIWLEDREMDIQ